MNRLGPRCGTGAHDGPNGEIGGRKVAFEQHSLICQFHMQRVGVAARVHCDGLQPEFTTRADDSAGDLAPISHEHLRER